MNNLRILSLILNFLFLFLKKLKFIYHSRIKQYKLYCFHTRYTSIMTEQIANNNEIIANNDNEKILKTNTYTLNAIKKYRAKNNDKIKEYNKQYRMKKKDELKITNPYLDYSKQQLFEKIFELENKLKELNS